MTGHMTVPMTKQALELDALAVYVAMEDRSRSRGPRQVCEEWTVTWILDLTGTNPEFPVLGFQFPCSASINSLFRDT